MQKELIEAVKSGDTTRVRELLDAGADPNQVIGDVANEAAETPLGTAAWRGNIAMVELLLDRGAKVDSMSWGGCDAVTGALLAGHLNLADLLYRHGAKTQLLIGLCFAENYAAIHEILHREPQRWNEYAMDSVRCGNLIMVEENLRRNPLISPEKNGGLIGSAIFQWRLAHHFPRKVNGTNDGFDRNNYQKITRMFLDWGVDPNLRNEKGVSVLHQCAVSGRAWSPTGQERVGHARQILDRGADVNGRDQSGQTALALAEERNHVELAQLFRSHGAVR